MDRAEDTISRIVGWTLNVEDLGRAITFYVDALEFAVEARHADHARVALGSRYIDLVQSPNGTPYPRPRVANDPWFQHFAIAVADMGVAYQRLSRFSPEPITQGGPQLLPPSTGSVTAYKFRDPDGHPLELFFAPGSSRNSVPGSTASVFLGIDHTALAVRSLSASIAFYTGLGFMLGACSLNQGPEQARLDGLGGAVVDIVTLFTPEAGPHVELLHYRSPASPACAVAAGDIAATQTVLTPLQPAARDKDLADSLAIFPDPDGHLLRYAIA